MLACCKQSGVETIGHFVLGFSLKLALRFLNILLDAKQEDDYRDWREFILLKHRSLKFDH